MGHILIPLTQGKFATIDAVDYELVSPIKWCAHYQPSKNSERWYAVSGTTAQKMHRLIMGAKANEPIDHIDGDGLNNKRSNLRIATGSINQRNQRKTRGTSRYMGVSHRGNNNRGKPYKKSPWTAMLKTDGPQRYLGVFATEEDAALAWNQAVLKSRGPTARLNVIAQRPSL
ncbi:HNH endonuclease [Glutamicibacter sp.]|jgi:hypothetical protein|uniref:HNH endonuclease n=1 Tax=Glutamicibacter sp. TaxID=1931995 RepID=UPI002FDB55AB